MSTNPDDMEREIRRLRRNDLTTFWCLLFMILVTNICSAFAVGWRISELTSRISRLEAHKEGR